MLSMAIAAIYPVYYMMETSLKTRQAWTADQFGLPIPPTLDNYAALLAGRPDPDLVHEQRHRDDAPRSSRRPSSPPWPPSRSPACGSAAGRSCCACWWR